MRTDGADSTFLLDVMCGKLAVYLRICGYDAAYAGNRGIEADDRLRALALEEGRTLVTRDRELAERTDGALFLTERDIEGQLRELQAAGIGLQRADSPTRCGRCNGVLESVPGDAPTPEYAPDPVDVDCWRCRSCGQHFWKGSHWDRVAETLD